MKIQRDKAGPELDFRINLKQIIIFRMRDQSVNMLVPAHQFDKGIIYKVIIRKNI